MSRAAPVLAIALGALLAFAPKASFAQTMPVILADVSTRTGVMSYLRFSNADTSSQTATVLLHDPASGATIAQWTTPRIMPGATLQVAVTDMLAAIAGSVSLPAMVAAEVDSAFMGSVQHVTYSAAAGTLANATTCGTALASNPLRLPFVSGPAQSAIAGYIRIGNASAQKASVAVTLVDNNGQSSRWISPTVQPMGYVDVAVSTIAPEAQLSPAASSLSVAADMATPLGLMLSYSEGLRGAATMGDFTAACALTPPMTSMANTGANTGMNTMGMGDMSCMMDDMSNDMMMCSMSARISP